MKKCIVGLTRQTTDICCCGQLPIIINRKKNPQNEKHLNWSEHEYNLLKFLSHVCEQLHYPKKVVNLDDASKCFIYVTRYTPSLRLTKLLIPV